MVKSPEAINNTMLNTNENSKFNTLINGIVCANIAKNETTRSKIFEILKNDFIFSTIIYSLFVSYFNFTNQL